MNALSMPGLHVVLDGDAKPAGGGSSGSEAAGDMTPLLVVFVLFIVVMMFFSSRSRKKQQAKFTDLYDGLKRDDRIMLQNGKFVVVDKVEKDRITVFADVNRNVKEVYHKNAVASLEADVFPDTETKKMEESASA